MKLLEIHEVINGSETLAKVSSISIAERSRVSILVKSLDSDTYGLGEDNHSIFKVTGRVAIYCLDIGF